MMFQLTAILAAASLTGSGVGHGGTLLASNLPARVATWTQAAWTSEPREFTADFPATPQVQGRAAENPDDSSFRSYQIQADGRGYLVRVDEYPASIRVPDPSPRAYAMILRVHAAEMGGHLVSTTPITLAGRPATEGRFETPAGVTEVRRVLQVGHRVYQVAYTHTPAAGSAAEGDAFLESFKLTGP